MYRILRNLSLNAITDIPYTFLIIFESLKLYHSSWYCTYNSILWIVTSLTPGYDKWCCTINNGLIIKFVIAKWHSFSSPFCNHLCALLTDKEISVVQIIVDQVKSSLSYWFCHIHTARKGFDGLMSSAKFSKSETHLPLISKRFCSGLDH